ncbi:MAG: dihydropyrimidinase [Planctomycetota bacterium]|jgi:dihydropyrimidinase
MALLIKGGRIITATEDYEADIYCADETITRIDQAIDPAVDPRAEVIDATGRYVFPGFIDPHVHVHLPFMGTFARDDYESLSKAALLGGTTTVIEMICPGRAEEPLEAFELWNGKAEGLSACDWTFHMGVTRFDDAAAAQLREIVSRGVASFKVFLAYKGAFGVTDPELYRTLKLASELGVIVTAHCENETLIDERQRELIEAGRTEPAYHEISRPPRVEAEGVHHLMTFAELTGAHVYVVHTSCEEAVQAARAAIDRGVNAWIETVIPYLVLDKSHAEQPGFEGAKYVMSPPIREKRHQPILWDGLRSRLISTVATDHAPFDFEVQKEMGRDDFTKIPNGIPSVQHRVDLLHTHGVLTGRIDLNTFVDCASTRAARIFGLRGKGRIAPGTDADLCIYDPAFTGTISAATHAMATDYSAFQGWPVTGRADVVTVRGAVAVRDGEFVGTHGRGRFIRREPTH